MSEIIEWAPFRLRAGVSEEALTQASNALQRDFLQSQPGFVSRRLLRAADGSYVDMVVWASEAQAMAAMEQAAGSDACRAYFSVMGADHAEPGAEVSHFVQLVVYA